MRKRGISLLEIIISLIIFAIGVAAVLRIFVAGKYFLKTTQNRSDAMNIASREMERYLAKSYNGLTELQNRAVADPSILTGSQAPFDWAVAIDNRGGVGSGEGVPGWEIPYKRITATCSYQERDVNAKTITKDVQLTNIASYPYIHVASGHLAIAEGDPGQISPPHDHYTPGVPGSPVQTIITTLQINPQVNKDILIYYNVALRLDFHTITDRTDLTPTILTKCFLDGNEVGTETRTPILGQPLISNALKVGYDQRDLAGNSVWSGGNAMGMHTLTIEWHDLDNVDNWGIFLKEANIIAIQIEARP